MTMKKHKTFTLTKRIRFRGRKEVRKTEIITLQNKQTWKRVIFLSGEAKRFHKKHTYFIQWYSFSVPICMNMWLPVLNHYFLFTFFKILLCWTNSALSLSKHLLAFVSSNLLYFVCSNSDVFVAPCPALSHLERCIAVVHGVFNKEILQHTDGQLPYLGPLLQGLGHLPQEQAHQKVVPAVFLSEAELQALLCCGTTQREGSAGQL